MRRYGLKLNGMKNVFLLLTVASILFSCKNRTTYEGKIFDTHLHFSGNIHHQLADLTKNKVAQAAVSSSWANMEQYRESSKTKFLIGMMFPCPGGIVPYSGQSCYVNGEEYPDIDWVEQLIASNQVDYLGEILTEYYGIPPGDPRMMPYYALALKYNIPVGIHTGLAGPNHLCPNYNPKMGDPALLEEILEKHKGLKLWIMHVGAPYSASTIAILKKHPQVCADISVIANPDLFDQGTFRSYMKQLVDNGLENQLMFGSDNGDLVKMIQAVNDLDFLTLRQKEKIFLTNAQFFFSHFPNEK